MSGLDVTRTNALASIDGPRLPARSRHAKQLVVFLHGYGADGNDLIDLGRQWQSWLPDAEFVAPHAPERCVQSPTGRQWFPLTSPRSIRALEGRQRRSPDARWFSRSGVAASRSRRRSAGAGRLQPGHHDGSACRSQAAAAAGRDLGLFGHAGRPRTPGRGPEPRIRTASRRRSCSSTATPTT